MMRWMVGHKRGCEEQQGEVGSEFAASLFNCCINQAKIKVTLTDMGSIYEIYIHGAFQKFTSGIMWPHEK